MDKNTSIDVMLLLATFRCLNEQLYNIKGTYSKLLKFKFNKLLNVARNYEKEIVKATDNSAELEAIYDCLMDVIMEVKEQVYEQN